MLRETGHMGRNLEFVLASVDEYGEPAHNTTYKHLWTNGPKEVFEYPDYSFEDHFGKITASYAPRAAIRDYIEGRFGRIPDLKEKIRFHTVVRLVEYDEDNDVFHVTTADLKTGAMEHMDFSHVIVASGVFCYPNTPEISGIETFEGRIMHSHDFKNPEELRGQTVLIIGAGWSAEDIAVLGVKFGAKMIYLSYRSVPIGKKWPIGKGWPSSVHEHPMVEKFEGNTAFFKDGASAQVDTVLFATGYQSLFPFLDEKLAISKETSFYPEKIYKAALRIGVANHKLFFLGTHAGLFSFSLFDNVAAWIAKYIMNLIPDEPKSIADMESHSKKLVKRGNELKEFVSIATFQKDIMLELAADAGYQTTASELMQTFEVWKKYRTDANCVTNGRHVTESLQDN
ncbi:SNO1-like protein [Mya arenaria]|uniref:Flavin-containing monooxygenase n=1 Tax=Mya arenaria TaxID=6604 RepID=A0ABY7F8S1_MYAAR|nr:SNO1-like protein [Mya arenaria]